MTVTLTHRVSQPGSAGILPASFPRDDRAGSDASAPRQRPPTLHDETIQAETLWSCTACSACVRVCPVRIDPLTLITDMRRNRVGEGALSGTAGDGVAANAIERQSVGDCPRPSGRIGRKALARRREGES